MGGCSGMAEALKRPAGFLALAVMITMTLTPLFAEPGADAVRSTVRVDRRSGKLIRRVAVPEAVLVSRLAEAQTIRADETAETPVGTKVDGIVDEIASQYSIDPLLVHAIIHVESRYNRFAISPKGAEGLMQLLPTTARRLGVNNSFDSRQNIAGGIRYLRQLQERFDDLHLVLAAYNAGEDAVSRYRGVPPYAETQEYVYRIGQKYGELRRSHKVATAQAQGLKSSVPAEPEHRPLETFVDEQGRLHLRTR